MHMIRLNSDKINQLVTSLAISDLDFLTKAADAVYPNTTDVSTVFTQGIDFTFLYCKKAPTQGRVVYSVATSDSTFFFIGAEEIVLNKLSK